MKDTKEEEDPKDSGKEGLTELPKFRTQSRPQWESNPAGKNVRSPFIQSLRPNPLGYRAPSIHNQEKEYKYVPYHPTGPGAGGIRLDVNRRLYSKPTKIQLFQFYQHLY